MHQRQLRYSVSTPPRIRPTAPPPTATVPNTPKALPRSPGSVNVVTSVLSAAGASIAPATPWIARAATSTPNDGAAPPRADASANATSAIRKIRLRPMRSPTRPPSSSRLPNASAYAVTIHCRSLLPKPRSCCADGSAMFTTVASSTTMSCAIETTTSTSQRCAPARASAALRSASPLIDMVAVSLSDIGSDRGEQRQELCALGRGEDAEDVVHRCGADRPRDLDGLPSGVGELDDAGPAVSGVVGADDQAVALETVDGLGHRSRSEAQQRRQRGLLHRSVGVEPHQHLRPGERDASRAAHRVIDDAVQLVIEL